MSVVFDKAWGISKTNYELHAQIQKYSQFRAGVEMALDLLNSGSSEECAATLRMALQSLDGY